MLHDGGNSYKEFYKFVVSTMNLVKGGDPSCDKTKSLILMPNSLVGTSTLEKLSLVYKFDFSTYQQRGLGSVITKIQKEISSKMRPTNPREIDYSEFKKAAEAVIQTYSPAESEGPKNNKVVKTGPPMVSRKINANSTWSRHLHYTPSSQKRWFASITEPQYV
jgi:hypothetical protein